MKKVLILMLLLVLPVSVLAQFNDHDGNLVVTWEAPDYGNPLDHYTWSYTINGVVDSLTGVSPSSAVQENSAILANVGDWAIFSIQAISVVDDSSDVIVSDTVYYNTELGIGPPRGVNWIQGP